MAVAIPEFLVAQELTIPRKARHLDLVAAMGVPPGLFGALQDDCAERCVLFEHESARLRPRKVASAMLGLAWLSLKWLSPSAEDAPRWLAETRRPPIAVVVADSVSAQARVSLPNLEARPVPGVYATRELERGGVILISIRDLEPDTQMDFWAWTGRTDNVAHARHRLDRLLGNALVPTIELNRIMEAVMGNRIEATEAEQETTYQRLRREFREEGWAEGRAEGRAEGLASLLDVVRDLAPEHVARLSAIDDPGLLKAEIVAVLKGRGQAL